MNNNNNSGRNKMKNALGKAFVFPILIVISLVWRFGPNSVWNSISPNGPNALSLIGTWVCKSTLPTENEVKGLLEGKVTFRSNGRYFSDSFILFKLSKFPQATLQWRMTGSGTYSRNRFNSTLTSNVQNTNLSNMSFVDGRTNQQDQELRRILDETFDLEGHMKILSEDTLTEKLSFIHSDKFVSTDLDNPDLNSTCTRTNAS